MKLFTKYSRINVVAMVVIFIIACGAFYFTLHFVLINQIDEDLKIEEGEIVTYVRLHNRLPENIPVKDQVISYAPTSQTVNRHFATSIMTDHEENEKERSRQLIFGISANGQTYQVTVSKSLEETNSIINSILLIAFITILAILVVSFFINRVVLKKIWKPFYQSLHAVKEFKVSKNQRLMLPQTQIDEFSFMNQTLDRITSQAQLEYLSLKTFSENASHEMQTPLAVIRSKLDLVIQDENLTEKQSQLLQTAYDSIQKLTRLNQSLLLLAKIENNQYEDVQTVDMEKKVKEKINDFHELWHVQQLTVHSSLKPASVKMNNELADILLNNLLSNATRHNYEGGSIDIDLNEHSLKVANTSNQMALDEHSLYKRFTKWSEVSDHNGLGLSIIRQICDGSHLEIGYSYNNNMHHFLVSWPEL